MSTYAPIEAARWFGSTGIHDLSALATIVTGCSMVDAPRRTIFLFPGIFGKEATFNQLGAELSLYYDVKVAPYPGPTASNDLLMDLNATAASLASWLLSIASDRPALLVGYSYGANLAFEVAGRLRAAGRSVALLALLDPALPTTDFEVHQRGPALNTVDAPLPQPELMYRSRLLRCAILRLCQLASARTRRRMERRTLWKLRSYARRAWLPRLIDCPVLHVITEQFAPAVAAGWAELCPEINQVYIGKRHVELLQGTALFDVVSVVAAALNESHDAASARAQPTNMR